MVLQNALPFPVNLQLGGGFQQTFPAEQGAAVAPNQTQTYVWQVPALVGPGKQDFSTAAYTYRSTVDPTAHENAGLIGAVVIGRQVSSASASECLFGSPLLPQTALLEFPSIVADQVASHEPSSMSSVQGHSGILAMRSSLREVRMMTEQ